MKMLLTRLGIGLILCCQSFAETSNSAKGKGGFYAFTVTDINGEKISLEKYRGKISLVVNVASECGYTDTHYQQLVKLQNKLAIEDRQPFTVLAFPCNQFGQQEPYDNQHILTHVTGTYGVNFPIFAKLDVVEHDAHPVYKFLTRNAGVAPDWNFWKYLVDGKGTVINAWGPRVEVDDLTEDIETAIADLKLTHSEL